MGCGQEPERKAVIWQAWLPWWPVAGGYKKPQASLRVRHKNNAKPFSSSLQALRIAVSPDGRVGNGVHFITVFTLISFAKFSLIASLQKACSKKKSRYIFLHVPRLRAHIFMQLSLGTVW